MNSKQYNLLKYASEHPDKTYTEITMYAGASEASYNRHCLDELCQLNYVHFWANPSNRPIEVTNIGFEALENYEAEQRAEAREEETIRIAKEANTKSDVANRTSKQANIISAIASIIAILTLLAQIFDWKLPQNTEQSYSQSQQSEYQSNN